VGEVLGLLEGLSLGEAEGDFDGCLVGFLEGCLVGFLEGCLVGALVGWFVVGALVGVLVGSLIVTFKLIYWHQLNKGKKGKSVLHHTCQSILRLNTYHLDGVPG
jgi:hypothetical protein